MNFFSSNGNGNGRIESSVIFRSGDLADEDHQLDGEFDLPELDGRITLNYLE